MRSFLVVLFFIVIVGKTAFAQVITLQYHEQPLNEVLLDINSRYNIPVSINSDLSSRCVITLDTSFIDIEDAMKTIAACCSLTLTKVNNVYSFRFKEKKVSEKLEKPVFHTYQGIIIDRTTLEPIPYAAIQLGTVFATTSGEGFFSVRSKERDIQIKIASLGYRQLDTILSPSTNLAIFLYPKITALREVILHDSSGSGSGGYSGYYPGQLKMNDVSTQLTPGQNVNAVFNNIKMFPGITSSGESISDYLIWGSYSGQNLTIYDDITIFNSWGISDDIGRLNPLMVKNIEVLKGGYGAEYGDRVGGLVLIDGKTGNSQDFKGEVNLSNQLALMRLNIPLLNKSTSLQIAGRKSYFNVIDLGIEQSLPFTSSIVPVYNFEDINIKWSTTFTNSNQLTLSAIHSNDSYQGQEVTRGIRKLREDIDIASVQTGYSGKYVHYWDQVGSTTITFSKSEFCPQIQLNYFDSTFEQKELRQETWENTIDETSFKLLHQFPIMNNVSMKFGAGNIINTSALATNTITLDGQVAERAISRYYLLGGGLWQASMRLLLKGDMRADFVSGQYFLQPRFNAIFDVSKHLSITGSWGKYYQFISNTSIQDFLGNTSNFWQVADLSEEKPVAAFHHIAGISLKPEKSIEINGTAYFIIQNGANSYILNRKRDITAIFRESKAYGFDIFIQKSIRKHFFILSYANNTTMERFRPLNGEVFSDFAEAPQSLRHELKATATLNYKHIKFSFSSVYGSGFPVFAPIRNDNVNGPGRRRQSIRPTILNIREPVPYWRTDVAVVYAFKLSYFDLAAGTSIINILNQRNIRLNQSLFIPDNTTLNTLGQGFTPTFYLKAFF